MIIDIKKADQVEKKESKYYLELYPINTYFTKLPQKITLSVDKTLIRHGFGDWGILIPIGPGAFIDNESSLESFYEGMEYDKEKSIHIDVSKNKGENVVFINSIPKTNKRIKEFGVTDFLRLELWEYDINFYLPTTTKVYKLMI